MPTVAWQALAGLGGALVVGFLGFIAYVFGTLGLARLRNIDEVVTSSLQDIRRRVNESDHEITARLAAAIAQINQATTQQLASVSAETSNLRELERNLAWARDAVAAGAGPAKPVTVHEAYLFAGSAIGQGQRALGAALLRSVADAGLQGSAPDYLNCAILAGSIDPGLCRRIGEAGCAAYPNNVDLWADLGQTCSASEDIAAADAAFQHAEAIPDSRFSWRFWVFYAEHLVRQGRYSDAYDLLERAKQALPASAMMWRAQAEAKAAIGENDYASELYRRAVEIEPAEDITRMKYAEFLFNRGRFDDASEQAKLAILYGGRSNESRWASEHVLLGKISLAQHRRPDARAAFGVAKAVNGDGEALLFLKKLDIEDGLNHGDLTAPTTND